MLYRELGSLVMRLQGERDISLICFIYSIIFLHIIYVPIWFLLRSMIGSNNCFFLERYIGE